jgi:acyl-CoA thioesterase-1
MSPTPSGYGDIPVLVNKRTLLRQLMVAALLLCAARPGAAAAPLRILAFGDSLTAGYGLAPAEAFPVRLQARLAAAGIAANVINGGVSGDTTAGGLSRLDWSLGDHPDLVLVELGANDALRGIDPKLTYDNLDKILAKLAQSGAKVMLLGMRAPANWGRDYQQQFDAIYPGLAEKYHVPLYPFFLDGVALDPALNQGDGLHPNARGVEIIVARLEPEIARLLQSQGAQK